jgi:type II secretory pathway pseudopilin PulG
VSIEPFDRALHSSAPDVRLEANVNRSSIRRVASSPIRRRCGVRELERRLQSARFKMRLRLTGSATTTGLAATPGFTTMPFAGDGDEKGFSILEALVATTIMAVALTALAQLFALATRANSSARATTYASVLAQQKMEQLRGLAWGFDALGLPLSDMTTDITAAEELPSGGRGLTPSPPAGTTGPLAENTAGYCDFLDGFGNSLGGGTTAPPSTVYLRRWSIEPLPTNPNNTLILQVLVARYTNNTLGPPPGTLARLPDEARLVSVKTRRAW